MNNFPPNAKVVKVAGEDLEAHNVDKVGGHGGDVAQRHPDQAHVDGAVAHSPLGEDSEETPIGIKK